MLALMDVKTDTLAHRRPNGGRPWSEEEDAVVLAMYIHGNAKAWDVAKAISTRVLGQSDIYFRAAQLRKKLNIPMVRRAHERSVKDWDLIDALMDEHMSVEEMAQMCGVGVSYVRQEMRKRGRRVTSRGWKRVGKKHSLKGEANDC